MSCMPDKGGILPNTPIINKDIKKNRLSLGGKRGSKTNIFTSTLVIPPMERRWSVVGAGWSKKKTTQSQQQLKQEQSINCLHLHQPLPPLSPVISLPCLQQANSFSPSQIADKENIFNLTAKPGSEVSYDFVRIPKQEYEAIKERVSAIETRISQEFNNVEAAISSAIDDNSSCQSNGPEKVQTKYEQMLENTEELLINLSTEQLAKRLSRELKIRRSGDNEHKVIRSPSARKIGSIRRRSREHDRHLTRNLSCNLGPSNTNSFDMNETFLDVSNYPKKSLKRGRPNTVQSGLRQPSPSRKIATTIDAQMATAANSNIDNEEWMNAEHFFTEDLQTTFQLSSQPSTPRTRNSIKLTTATESKTPYFVPTVTLQPEIKTPMLPPRLAIVKKTPAKSVHKTPMLPPLSATRLADRQASATINKTLLTPLQEQLSGRASIARLRSQNAGMVAAKAKLFGGMVTEHIQPLAGNQYLGRENSRFVVTHRRQGNCLLTDLSEKSENKDKQKHRIHKNHTNTPKKSTPRRGNQTIKNSNGIHRRQQLRLAKSPGNKKSPLKSTPMVIHRRQQKQQNHHQINGSLHQHNPATSPTGNITTSFNSYTINDDIKKMVQITCSSPTTSAMMSNDRWLKTDTTPHIKRPLVVKSPRRLLRTPQTSHERSSSSYRSPMRATPLKKT